MPVSVWLLFPHNTQLIRTVTASATPSTPFDKKRERKSKAQTKARQKMLKINSAISERDLSTKLSHVCEWLEKGYLVSVLILKIENKPQVNSEDL